MANSRVKHTAVPSSVKKTAASTVGASRPSSRASAQRSGSVEQRAYEIYMKRVSAGTPGDQIGDWLQAESEIRSEAR